MFEISSDHFKSIREGPWEKAERTDYRISLDHENKIIYVIGRESGDEDWPDNFDFRKREPPVQWFDDNPDILVHAGFLRQYQAVRDTLLDVCKNYIDYAIRISGYSLGASWTQIFIEDCIHRWPFRDLEANLYAPANPWYKLSKKYQIALAERTTFVKCYWDFITWMRVIGFHRYGKTIYIGKPWRVWSFQHSPEQIIRGLDEKFPLEGKSE